MRKKVWRVNSYNNGMTIRFAVYIWNLNVSLTSDEQDIHWTYWNAGTLRHPRALSNRPGQLTLSACSAMCCSWGERNT